LKKVKVKDLHMKINTKVSHHDLVQKYKSLVDGEEILKPGFKISNKKLKLLK